MRWLLAVIMAGLMLAGAQATRADSWAPPEVRTYVSANGQYRLTVSPRELRSQLAYFEDAVEDRPSPGQQAEGRAAPEGRLERLGDGGEWEPVWEGRLVNGVSPVSALVADDGEHFVTFDNWHSIGFGDNVIVIYRGNGAVVRSMCLNAFLPNSYLNALPRSVSSLSWNGDHSLGEVLRLQVRIPAPREEEESYVAFVADLNTGEVHAEDAEAWIEALEAARVRNEETALARHRSDQPILGPSTSDAGDWHHYMLEAHFRTRFGENADRPYPSIHVLHEPSSPQHAESIEWIRRQLVEPRSLTGVIMLGSPAPEALLALLTEIRPDIDAVTLQGSQIFIVADDDAWPLFQDVLSESGMNLFQIDPTEPIVQRPDRMSNGGGGFVMEDWGDC